MNKSRFATRDFMREVTSLRSRLVGLAFALATCSTARVLYAQPLQERGMRDMHGGWMGGWGGGGMWLWSVIGVLVVVLLVVVILRLSGKRSIR